jgi:hypothetical protein
MTDRAKCGGGGRLRFTLLLGLFALKPLAVGAQQDMQAYLRETQAKVQAGAYEEALERFIWFYENSLQYRPSMAGVRNSFALGDWMRLGEVYPPAFGALVAKRDETLARLLQNPLDRSLLIDLRALNRTLEQEQRTIQVFEQIASDPAVAGAQWSIISGLALETKRYDLITRFGIDLLRELERETELRELMIRPRETTLPAARLAFQTQSADNRLVTQTLLLIEAAVALG